MNRLQESLIRLLRWSEKYTKTDMVYLASGGFWSVVGQLSASICALILSIFLSRYLTQTDYGTYKYVLSIVAILGTFSLSGLSGAVFQSVARGFDGALSEGFWINLRWSILIFLGAFVLGAYYYLQGNLILAVGVLVGGCLSPLMASANMYTSFLPAKKDFIRQTLYIAVWGNLFPVLALITTAVLTKSAVWVTLVYFAANTLVALYFYRQTKRVYKPDASRSDTGMLSYSKHLSLIGILSGIAGNLDNVLVYHFVGAPALAIYAFATGIVDQSKGPLKMLDTMTQAQFVSRSPSDARAGMHSKMLWLFGLAIVSIVVYIPLAPLLYSLLFPRYLDAVAYSQIYVFSLLMIVFWPASSYIQAKKMLKEQYVSSIVGSLLTIITLAVGVIGWGLLGLIIARVITRLGGNGFSYYLYLRSKEA